VPGEQPALLAALGERLLGGGALPDLAIHRDDHMFRFILGHHHGQRGLALVDYFRSGWSAAQVALQVLAWRFGPGLGAIRLLDFAAGFGRVTRFYLRQLPASRVWVSDIFPEAVEFQRRRLGVHGFASNAEPGELRCGDRFDAVVVSSLFSHLPQLSFQAWLARLGALVAPGGVLLVSVHDQVVLPPNGELSEGFCFQEGSEIPELGGDYGATWVDEEFMARAVAAATGGAGAYLRLPRALWSYQDLYVIAPDGALPVATLPFRPEPLGYLDDCELSADGRRLKVRGWAADHSGPGIAEVRLQIGRAAAASCRPSSHRPDVSDFLRRPVAEPTGWSCTLEAPQAFGPDDLLSVTAVSRSGATFLIHLGAVEPACGHVRLLQQQEARRQLARELATSREESAALELRLRRLQEHVATMEASRFWKLRELWWRGRRAVGRG
jgi:SAM-dependent methyltransferase